MVCCVTSGGSWPSGLVGEEQLLQLDQLLSKGSLLHSARDRRHTVACMLPEVLNVHSLGDPVGATWRGQACCAACNADTRVWTELGQPCPRGLAFATP
jgi:hypothetical protein